MTDRREFLTAGGIAAAGAVATTVAITGLGAAASVASPNAEAAGASRPYQGPHALPKGLTLLSIHQSDGSETLGIVHAGKVIDVRAAARQLHLSVPLDMETLLRDGSGAALTPLMQAADAGRIPHALLDEAAIRHGRLFTRPGKIICVGLNYRRHAREVKMAEPRVPPLFNKFNNSLAAHECTITLPPKEVAYKFDYETELLIVMGKAARNVSEDSALDYVAGYCTSNDFSARDLQLETPSVQWMIGKTLDNFAPIGPYFVSADVVGNPNALKLETRVNGEVRQSWSTDDFIFNTQQMVAYISKHWTLEPGDLILTGTPHGVILGMPKDQQVWLKAGDVIESSIEKLGTLRFRLA